MKVVMLTPCLMMNNNRKANMSAMAYARENYSVDEIVVNDQEFSESDYVEGVSYIGRHKERQGFARSRNQLLEWFYNSDYDFAVWIDANEKISRTSLNDFETILNACKNDDLFGYDAVKTTLGLHLDSLRIDAKKRPDYFDGVWILPQDIGGPNGTMHALVMRNFRKFGMSEVYIDDRCNPKKGTSEDIYFTTLLSELYNTGICPTIVVSKPSNKTSTWMHEAKSYAYPPVDMVTVSKYVRQALPKFEKKKQQKKACFIKRSERFIELIKPYRPRSKRNKVRPKSLI